MAQWERLRRKLVRRLACHGWERTAAEPLRDNEQRIGEVWTLASLWSPRGLRAYLVIQCHPYRDEPWEFIVRGRRPSAAAEHGEGRISPYWLRANDLAPLVRTLATWRDQNVGRDHSAEPAAGPAGKPMKWSEEVWQEATRVELLLPHLRPELSDRKKRLLACACLRRLPVLLEEGRNLRAVEAMERYADGLCPKRDMKKARKAARIPWLDSYEPADEAEKAIQAFQRATLPHQHPWLCELLRDLAGNPFRPGAVRPSWLNSNGGAVAHLARVIYEERRFEDLPVLADALEDAGCANADLLAHCRSGAEHFRGCSVLDLLLGKS